MPELKLDNSIVDERYYVERCLSQGSYAEIFLARDMAAGEELVIIKALNSFLQGTPDPELEQTLVENFQNEAIALDKVRHPNIIRRLGHGTASDLNGTPFHYLVLEYMAGGDLLGFCRTNTIELDPAIFYFGQVAAALAYAHSQQVIHRDIKPNNLLLSADQQVIKVADFGVAKISPDDQMEVTRVGTDLYAPPEHHPDSDTTSLRERLTPSADIYSLAKTIYTAMCGKSPSKYAHKPIGGLPEPLASRPWAGRLLGILAKATASRVADRYQTVEEFWKNFAGLRQWVVNTTGGLCDPEATLVRPRSASAAAALELNSGLVQSPSWDVPVPDFQPHTGSGSAFQRGDKARIVIELPKTPPPIPESPVPVAVHSVPVAMGAAVARPKVVSPANAPYRGLQAPIPRPARSQSRGTKILKILLVLILIAGFVSLLIASYRYFARRALGQPRNTGGYEVVNREGVISGATNVYIRTDPKGDIITSLPAGTRVRALETRGLWVRIEIVKWPGPPPDGAPSTGWVGLHFVSFD